jgi:hypothetical protein
MQAVNWHTRNLQSARVFEARAVPIRCTGGIIQISIYNEDKGVMNLNFTQKEFEDFLLRCHHAAQPAYPADAPKAAPSETAYDTSARG